MTVDHKTVCLRRTTDGNVEDQPEFGIDLRQGRNFSAVEHGPSNEGFETANHPLAPMSFARWM